MMKFNFFYQIGCVLLLAALSTSLSAKSIPMKCPGLTALQQTSFVSAEKTPAFPDKWYVMQKNNYYDTNEKWDFAILVPAEDNDDTTVIFAKANAAISRLQFPSGPTRIEENFWICEYQLPGSNEAIAFYPAQ